LKDASVCGYVEIIAWFLVFNNRLDKRDAPMEGIQRAPPFLLFKSVSISTREVVGALDIVLIASRYPDSFMFAGPNGARVAERTAVLAAFPEGQEFLNVEFR